MAGARVSWVESLVVGVVVFGLAGTAGTLGCLAALVAYLRTDGGLWDSLNPAVVTCAAASASVVGVLTWRFTVRAAGASRRRGAVAGLIVGLAAHPVCWFLCTAYAVAGQGARQGAADVAFSLVFSTVLISISSLGVVGWITAPLGAFLGYLVQGFKPARREASPLLSSGPQEKGSTHE